MPTIPPPINALPARPGVPDPNDFFMEKREDPSKRPTNITGYDTQNNPIYGPIDFTNAFGPPTDNGMQHFPWEIGPNSIQGMVKALIGTGT